MRRSVRFLFVVIGALALVAGACSSDADDDESVVATEEAPAEEEAPAPEEEEPPAAEEEAPPAEEEEVPAEELDDGRDAFGIPLQVTAVDLVAGVATLTNAGTEQYDLAGHWLCNRPSYAELPDQVLEPGETLEVGIGGFSADGSEVAIYTSSTFSATDDIVTYVAWGAGGGRQSVAEDAGIWSGDPVQPTGDAITLTGAPGSAAGWSG